MALSLKLSGILWWNFANTLVLTRCSSWVCQMTFGIGRGFAEVQILKKVEINSKTVWNILIKFYRHLMLKRSSPRNCKMTFPIGWSFAECQILKKWKWPYLLNCVEYFDKLLRKHWYWHDLAQEIANWHFFIGRGFGELQKVKIALSLELSGILWWNFAYTLILTRCSQMTFGLVAVLSRFKF